MRIANNLAALNVINIKSKNTNAISNSIEKLSSGLRINKAADDAAGLSISQKMRAQIRGLSQASRNAQDGISLIQTAEGALGEMTDITQRIRELCLQGANGTLTDEDRKAIQSELNQFKLELHNIASQSEFNTKKLLDGSLSNDKTDTINKVGKVEELLNIGIPDDGTAVNIEIQVDEETLSFNFKNLSAFQVQVDVENDNDLVAQKILDRSATLDPEIDWQKELGRVYPGSVLKTIETRDGGYITIGCVDSSNAEVSGLKGESDVWVIKYDIEGNIEWNKAYGGAGDDFGSSIFETSDGGYMVSGTSYGYLPTGDLSDPKGWRDAWFVKIDATGNLMWEKSMGASGEDGGPRVLETSTGDFVFTYSYPITTNAPGSKGLSDVHIMKVNSSGNVLWDRLYGGTSWDNMTQISLTPNDEIIFFAETVSNNGDVSNLKGNSDIWGARLDLNGDIIWSKTYGGSNRERFHEIQPTADGGLLVLGTSMSVNGDLTGNNGNEDVWIFKIDTSGNLMWQKNLGGGGIEYPAGGYPSTSERQKSIGQTIDGNIYLNLISNSTNGDLAVNYGNNDHWIVKLDSSGNMLWNQVIGDANSNSSRGFSVTSDGGVLVNSSSLNRSLPDNIGLDDFGMAKFDSTGNLEWQKSYGSNQNDTFMHAFEDTNGSIILTGIIRSRLGVIKLNQNIIKSSAERGISIQPLIKGERQYIFENANLVFSDDKLKQLVGISFDWSVLGVEKDTKDNSIGFQIGANADQMMRLEISDMRPNALGFNEGFPSVIPIEHAGVSLVLSDNAISKINSQRSLLGSKQNGLEHMIRNLENAIDNLTVANSRIIDADMAKEIMDLTRLKILDEVSNLIAAQSNQWPKGVIKLLSQ